MKWKGNSMSRLKEIREKNGLTQNQLAKLSGVGQNMISKYEAGTHQIGEDNMIKLIKALNTNADYFLGLIEEAKKERS